LAYENFTWNGSNAASAAALVSEVSGWKNTLELEAVSSLQLCNFDFRNK